MSEPIEKEDLEPGDVFEYGDYTLRFIEMTGNNLRKCEILHGGLDDLDENPDNFSLIFGDLKLIQAGPKKSFARELEELINEKE